MALLLLSLQVQRLGHKVTEPFPVLLLRNGLEMHSIHPHPLSGAEFLPLGHQAFLGQGSKQPSSGEDLKAHIVALTASRNYAQLVESLGNNVLNKNKGEEENKKRTTFEVPGIHEGLQH